MSNSSAAALVDQGTPLEPWRKRFDDTRALEVLLRLLAALPSPIDGTAMLNAAAAADHSSPSLAAVAPATEALELDHGSISGMDLDATVPLVSTAPSAPKIMPRPRVKRVLICDIGTHAARSMKKRRIGGEARAVAHRRVEAKRRPSPSNPPRWRRSAKAGEKRRRSTASRRSGRQRRR